jgi:5-methylcytosine-specific restriction enzyme subunit McrC
MIQIEVTESGPGSEVELTAIQASALATSKIVSVVPVASGRWLVGGTGKVGVAQIGDVIVRVFPKLPIQRIFYLLGYGRRFEWRDDLVPYETETDLVHVLADAFVRQADRALSRGVIQGYVERDDDLAVVRGRMRHTEQATRRFGQITPLLVRYDDFTIDIAENQLVRAAAKILRRVPGLDSAVARRLRAIMQRLDEVSDLIPGQQPPTWRSGRRNAHYETVLWFASMVLKNRALDLPAGDIEVNGFVIDMATVFEDFVTIALTDALERIDGRVRAQDPHTLDEGGTVKMAPDLVWYRGGKPVAIVDAKYKAEKIGGYPNADLYQMLAYCTSLGVPVGDLVYAKGNESAQQHLVRQSSIRINAHALDLDVRPSDLMTQVADLARRITRETTEELG